MVVNLGRMRKHFLYLTIDIFCQRVATTLLYKSTIFPTAYPTQYYSVQLYTQQWSGKEKLIPGEIWDVDVIQDRLLSVLQCR